MELRRITALMLAAEKAELHARAAKATAEADYYSKHKVEILQKTAEFWAAELQTLRARLLVLLADSAETEAVS